MWKSIEAWIPHPSMNYTTDGHTLLDTVSTKTRMSAENTLAIMKENGWKSAIIVAPPQHIRRVRRTFRKRWGTGYSFSVIKAQS